MLDQRLALAASLYTPCALGADIGTDHGLLPCHLLKENICQRMILADVSPKALEHARDQVRKQRLEARAELVCADGLNALTAPCGCVSIMGMGGELIGRILEDGQARLQGADLVLSAHTDLHLVRRAVQRIGYHITAERLCRAAGRFYLVWKAEPGAEPITDEAVRYGTLLFQEEPALLQDYLTWRIAVLQNKLDGLCSAKTPDETAITTIRQDIAFYQFRLEV